MYTGCRQNKFGTSFELHLLSHTSKYHCYCTLLHNVMRKLVLGLAREQELELSYKLIPHMIHSGRFGLLNRSFGICLAGFLMNHTNKKHYLRIL